MEAVFLLTVLALQFDVGAFIKGLILLLLAGAAIALGCYIVARILGKFFSGLSDWAWILWAIGGLLWLLVAWNIFGHLLT